MINFAPSKSTMLLAVCFAVVSVLFYNYAPEENGDVLEKHIIKSWVNFIRPPEKQFQRLAVGVNSNVDIIVPGVALLKALNISPAARKNNDVLNNLNELQETFSHFFGRGSAAERAFTDKVVYEKIIQTAETLGHVEHFIGGNAALMAKKASALFPDLKVHFVGPVGPLLESLMPKSVAMPASCKIPKDEMHLIMEYKTGEQWGAVTAPVANRFITSHDDSNAKVIMLEPFFESIKSFKPDLIILSGFQIMDSQSPEFFHQRLDTAVSLLQQVPASVPVHLELASMANRAFVKKMLEKVVPNVDSLGLNEQEIVFSSKASNGPHNDQFDDEDSGQPEIYKISDIILWLLETYGRSAKSPNARLTRVHFHSLTYHIVAVVPDTWSNVERAAAAGTQIAGLQACDISTLDEDMVELKIPRRFKLYTGDEEREFDSQNPVLSWEKGGYLFVFSPVLVCKNPGKTVGLGDAISATGLMFSQFLS